MCGVHHWWLDDELQTYPCVCLLFFAAYSIWHELFSRNGFTFWLENPTSKQSSCSCSVTYFAISAHACDTGIRWIFASRRNCSTILRCCCKLFAIRSIWAVSESPVWKIENTFIVVCVLFFQLYLDLIWGMPNV